MIQKLVTPLVTAAVEPLVKLAEKAGAAMGLALGLVVFVIAIALGVVIPHHVGGVMLAALGAASGTVLISAASSRLFRPTVGTQQDENLAEHNAKLQKELNAQRDLVHGLRREQNDSEAQVKGLKDQLEKQEKAVADSEEKTVLLTREVCRLENQRINVDSVMPVLRLQLLSVEARLRDWRHQAFNENGKPIKQLKGVGDYEFLGLLETECTVNLGVDLAALRLSENKNGIVVTGLRPCFQGFEEVRPKWIHHELREQERTATSLKSGELIVHAEHHRIAPLLQRYLNETLDRLNQGLDFKHHDTLIRRMAEAFVRVLLDRLGKPLQFDWDSTEVKGLPLREFIDGHNEEVDRQLLELSGKPMEPQPAAKARRSSR